MYQLGKLRKQGKHSNGGAEKSGEKVEKKWRKFLHYRL